MRLQFPRLKKPARVGTHFLILFAITLVARLWTEIVIFSASMGIYPLLIRGILSDAVICMLLALIAGFFRPLLSHAIYAVWALCTAANLSHLDVNSVNIDLANTSQLEGEALIVGAATSMEVTIGWLALWALGLMVAYLLPRCRWYRQIVPVKLWLLLIGAGAVTLSVLPSGSVFWRYYHVLEENFIEYVLTPTADPGTKFLQSDPYLKKMTALDLSGEFYEKNVVKKPNVLIIVIEGLSDFFLREGYMPYLASLAERSIHYPNFLYANQFTSNGLYSTLCGDYPTLEPGPRKHKWPNTIREGPYRPCLPSRLRKLGYYTAFFQGSDLTFTSKGRFMAQIGFEVAYAARRLEQPGENLPYKRGFFGLMLSDDYHYSKIAEKVIEMEHGKKPWFTTIMTTSTHTPYNINPDYFKRYKTNHEAAFRFADDELKKFLARLDNAGILDHTLIFITGDESRLRKDKHVDPGRWSRHWSTLVVKTPNNTQYKSEDYFMHADIAVSVLDYLGNVSGKERFRSVFRTYETFRPVMFSGVYTKIWGAIPEPDRLLTCRSNFTECSAHYISGPLFTGRILKPAPMHDLQFFISATRHSDLLVTQPHSTNKPAAKKKVKKRKRRILRPPNMPW